MVLDVPDLLLDAGWHVEAVADLQVTRGARQPVA
jgi:hypothetical protein